MSEITINFAADTSAFDQGVATLDAGMETVEKALDAIAAKGDSVSKSLVLDFLKSERAAKSSAEEVEHVLTESYKVPAEAAKEMARIATSSLDDVQDEADKTADATGKIGDKLGDVGSIAKDALEGDFAGAAQKAGDSVAGVAAGVGGLAGAVGGIVASGVFDLVGSAIEGIQNQSEEMKQVVSDNFREMAENGISAWETVQSQTQRLTEAYDEHEAEIQKIADLVGLPFESVAAAWAGNADAIATVSAAYAEMNSELRNTPGVSVEAAEATIRGWEGVLKPLNDTLVAYDEARDKAQRFTDQVKDLSEQEAAAAEAASQRAQAADQARWESFAAAYDEAANKPPIEVKSYIQNPDVNLFFDAMQMQLRGKELRIDVGAYTRTGQRVV